jgi:hypothetical protein
MWVVLQAKAASHFAMKVVLGMFTFADPGGTESYVLTVARELARLGHEPTIAIREAGPMAEQAASLGLKVSDDSACWPDTCDAVFAHDALMHAELSERYPGARVVFFCHSTLFNHQLPVLLPEIVDAFVVASDTVARRVRALALEAPIVRLRQPIDTEHFRSEPIRAKPERALILSNYLHGRRRAALVEAWEAAGVEFRQVGAPTASETDVVAAICQADIVVAKARAALEGMSCGRAVYVYDQWGGDGWVTPSNYDELEAANFSGLAISGPREPEQIAADLGDYSPDMGWLNRELVLTHHSARRHAEELVEVLRGARCAGDRDADSAISQRPRVLSELARLGRNAWQEPPLHETCSDGDRPWQSP